MVEFVSQYWMEIAFGLLIIDKIVAVTPTKWDDMIFTAIKSAVYTTFPKLKPKE